MDIKERTLKIGDTLKKWLQLLGVGANGANSTGIAELSHAQELKNIEALPESYRANFELGTPADSDEFIGREKQLSSIENIFSGWLAGSSARFAIHGLPGSGRSSLVNVALDKNNTNNQQTLSTHISIKDTSYQAGKLVNAIATSLELNLADSNVASNNDDGTAALEGLIEQLNDSPRRVIVLHRCHNLFVRDVGGYEAVRALQRLSTATSPNVLWIMTFDSFALQLLNRIVSFSDCLTDTIALGPIEVEVGQQLIEARHNESTLPITFYSGSRGQPGDALSDQDTARKRFFADLNHVACGNPLAAQFHWLASLSYEDGALKAFRPNVMAAPALDSLTFDQLTVLTMVLQQAEVSPADLAKTFGWDKLLADQLLGTLLRRGLLKRRNGNTLRVNPVMVEHLAAELSRQRLLQQQPKLMSHHQLREQVKRQAYGYASGIRTVAEQQSSNIFSRMDQRGGQR